jgi:hypothetical protein
MQIVSEIVGASGAAVAVENSKEAYLRPFYIYCCLIFRLQNIQNNRNSVFIIISNDALVGVGSIRLNNPTLLLTSLRRLVILQLNGFCAERGRVVAEEESLHLHKLNIRVLWLLTGWWRWRPNSLGVGIGLGELGISTCTRTINIWRTQAPRISFKRSSSWPSRSLRSHLWLGATAGKRVGRIAAVSALAGFVEGAVFLSHIDWCTIWRSMQHRLLRQWRSFTSGAIVRSI